MTTAEAPTPAITTDDRGYTDGLNELVFALRTYTGLSQVGMAIKLGIDRRAYQRIERGQESAPPRFIESMQSVLAQFDAAVDSIVAAGRQHRRDGGVGSLQVAVSPEPREEWGRCVAGRAAALETALVTPMLMTTDD